MDILVAHNMHFLLFKKKPNIDLDCNCMVVRYKYMQSVPNTPYVVSLFSCPTFSSSSTFLMIASVCCLMLNEHFSAIAWPE